MVATAFGTQKWVAIAYGTQKKKKTNDMVLVIVTPRWGDIEQGKFDAHLCTASKISGTDTMSCNMNSEAQAREMWRPLDHRSTILKKSKQNTSIA